MMRVPATWPSAGFQALPSPVGAAPFRVPSARLGLQAPLARRVFHVIGDTGGVLNPRPQQAVVKAMVADLRSDPSVAFAYHVGDAGYFNGEPMAFMSQFFEAYEGYGKPIIGVPGNHDGWPLPGCVSLEEWMAVFCQADPGHFLPGTEEYGRPAMSQPYCYWTLQDPAVTIIGLYSNVPSGGVIEADQAEWLAGELRDARPGVPVIVAAHHPPYSADSHHGSSPHIGGVIDAAAGKAGRRPDLVMSGHVHNYQRFDRDGVPYLVVGFGGYRNLHAVDASVGDEIKPGVTLKAFSPPGAYGFVTLTIEAGKISGDTTYVTEDGAFLVGEEF